MIFKIEWQAMNESQELAVNQERRCYMEQTLLFLIEEKRREGVVKPKKPKGGREKWINRLKKRVLLK